MRRLLIIYLAMFYVITVQAGIEVHVFDSPEKETRYKTLINELRCLVCQNQNLADSNAELAQQLRAQTFRMIDEGASDDDVIEFMVSRYGDFVLYKPPLKPSTYLLWLGPFILLFTGIIIMRKVIRKNQQSTPQVSQADYDKARQLLEDKDNNS